MSRARELHDMFTALDHDLMPPADDMHALAVLVRAQRLCRDACDRAFPPAGPWNAVPAWQHEFSFEMQMAFLMGRAYQVQVAGG